MVNKSGRIGRDGEHTAREYLAAAGFEEAVREGKRAASLDIVAPGLSTPVEVKRRGTLDVPGWTRTVESRHGSVWALFVIQRDARKKMHPDMMIVPAAFGAKLLKLWELHKDMELYIDEPDVIPAYGECIHLTTERHLFKEIT